MMPRELEIEPGAVVEAVDGRLGTVDEVIVQPTTGELSYLVLRRGWSDERLTLPAALVGSIPDRHTVRLTVDREEARQQATSVPSDAVLARGDSREIRVPVHEERLIAAKRMVDLGELRVHKWVEQVEESVTQPVTRDDLVVERVAANRPLDAPVAPRDEGDWLVVPIMEEVLVVSKRLMLREEVRIRKQQITEDHEVRELVRHERVELEDATVYGVAGLTDMKNRPGSGDPSRTGPRGLADQSRESESTTVVGDLPSSPGGGPGQAIPKRPAE